MCGRADSALFEIAAILPTQSQRSYNHKKVPELRLCGNWLEKAGFSPENYVSVTVMDGLLVIRSTATVDKDS